MNTPAIIMWVLIGGGVISAVVFVMTMIGGGKKAKRIKSVTQAHRSDLARRQMEDLSRPSAIRQQKEKLHVAFTKKIMGALNLQHLLQSDAMRVDLAQAGIRGRGAVAAYISTRLVMGIGAGVTTIIMLGLAKNYTYPEFTKFLFAGAGAVVGFFLPKLLLANTVTKRQQQMTDVFPDALDLLTICVESGLGIESAFSRVTEEIMESSPVLAQEFGLLTAELAYLGDRKVAYDNFSKRTGMESAKALSTALIQSEQYGTPVGVALKVLSKEKRDERMSNAEKKAAALPAKLTVPMILFFLPVLFIVVIGPAAMQVGK